MNAGMTQQEHEVLLRGLRDLGNTPPPRAVWQRIEEQARAEKLFAPHVAERTKWFAGAGIAAAVALAVLNMPLAPVVDNGQVTFPTEPAYTAADEEAQNLQALMVQSRQIERNLRALPEQPSVVRASTAATISELEDQIAAIDYVLAHPELQLNQSQQEMYWRH